MLRKVLIGLTAVLLLAGCGRQAPLSHRLTGPVASSGLRAMPGLTQGQSAPKHLEGVIGPGALYEIDVPAEWNGDLVLYAHGYTLPTDAIAIPTNQDGFVGIRNLLLDHRFAVAITSYSRNGYAAAEGARQVHQLRGLFVDLCGEPSRVFLLGQSLGGIIGIELAETHPKEYAGALLVSGVLGGTRRQVSYVGDTRVLFDYLWPGVLEGTITDVPDEPFIPGVRDRIIAALVSDQARFGALLCTFRDPRFHLAGMTGPQLVETVVRTIAFQWVGGEDLFDRTHQHQLYDNDDALYVGCAPSSVRDAINAGVVRYSSTRDAENFMRNHYEPTGNLKIPVLTLHAEHDPSVPAGHEAVYQEKATAAGSQGYLVQCVVANLYGHTEAFTPQQVVQAFEALVAWVNSGQKPSCPVFQPS